jgi:hypothetical protein
MITRVFVVVTIGSRRSSSVQQLVLALMLRSQFSSLIATTHQAAAATFLSN